MLLSAGMDCKVKLWKVLGNREVIQTYIGHTKAVKDICFNNDGMASQSNSSMLILKLSL
jgi:pre-mRNA-processing factor 17